MKLYDNVIYSVQTLLEDKGTVRLPLSSSSWNEVSDRSMILRSDMAYELGSGRYDGLGLTLITDNKALVETDSLELYGNDLPAIKADGPYARIALVLVASDVMGEGDHLYSAIRRLEYTRYHFYPEGFMNRISSSKHKESVRVSKESLRSGLTFSEAGSMMIKKFKENPEVRAVRLIYVTADDFDYGKLFSLSCDAEEITKTIDHILKNVQMDCKICNLQEICNEVEGLRELHFGQKND